MGQTIFSWCRESWLKYLPCLVRVAKSVKVMMNQGIASLVIRLFLDLSLVFLEIVQKLLNVDSL